MGSCFTDCVNLKDFFILSRLLGFTGCYILGCLLGGLVGTGFISPSSRLDRVPNGPSKTGLDQLVWSKVKSSPRAEIRPTGWSGLVGQGPPSNRICTAH